MYRTDLIRSHAYATGEGRMLRSLSRSGGPGLCPAAYAAGYTEIAHPALHALDYFTGLFHVDKDIDGPRVWEGRRPRRPKRQHRISTTDGRRPTIPVGRPRGMPISLSAHDEALTSIRISTFHRSGRVGVPAVLREKAIDAFRRPEADDPRADGRVKQS